MDPSASNSCHPYYALLPSYVTPENVARERDEFVARVEETKTLLARLLPIEDDGARNDQDAAVIRPQKRHLRVIETLFKLKHGLPKVLHRELIDVLVRHLWELDGRCLGDIEIEIRAVRTLEILLRKWRTRRPRAEHGELRLSWRLAKRALDRVCFRTPGAIPVASQVNTQCLVTAMGKCVERARPFFVSGSEDREVVDELWDEFAGQIQDVRSNRCFKALGYMSLFLNVPTTERAWKAVETRIPTWFAAWASISRCASWDGHWFKIFARVLKRHPVDGARRLQSYLPFLFAKVHDLLDLPSDLGAPFKNKVWPTVYSVLHGSKRFDQYAMRLSVYLLTNPDEEKQLEGDSDATANEYILEILNAIKAFFHPSNASNTANSLGVTVYYFTTMLSKRLGEEKGSGKQLLSYSSCLKIYDALLEIAFYGIYSKSRSVSSKCMYVIKNLICLDPKHCGRPVLDQMVRALDPLALSQSHMAPAAISAMSVFLYHLMVGQDPNGPGLLYSTYLPTLLSLTLPGIDASDEKKTISTITLYFHVLSWLPLVNDVSKQNAEATKTMSKSSRTLFEELGKSTFASIREVGPDIQLKQWELGSFLEEWSLALVDRCLDFIRARTSNHSVNPDSSTKAGPGGRSLGKKNGDDEAVNEVLNMMSMLYTQMSPSIFAQALTKTATFVSNSFFTSEFGGRVVASLVFDCMYGNAEEAFPRFFGIVIDKLKVTKQSIDVSQLMLNEKVWYLHILNGLVRVNSGNAIILLSRRAELLRILEHFLWQEDQKEVYEAAGDCLQHLLHALLGVYPTEFRSLPDTEWRHGTSDSAGMHQYLGAAVSWKQLNVKWHEPVEDEVSFAMELLREHLLESLSRLNNLRQTTDGSARTWIPHLKRVYNCVRGARNGLVDSIRGETFLQSGSFPLLARVCVNNPELLNELVGVKGAAMTELHDIVQFWLAKEGHGVTENQVWHLVLKTIKQLLVWRGSHIEGHRSKEKQNTYIKATTTDIASRQFRKLKNDNCALSDIVPLASRNEMIERVLFFYSKRKIQEHFEAATFVLANDGSANRDVYSLYTNLLGDVEALLQSPYEEVQRDASSVLQESSDLYARWLYSRLSDQVATLEGTAAVGASTIKEENIIGALDLLLRTRILHYLWKSRTILIRVLQVLLNFNDKILKSLSNEPKKAKISLQIQTLFLTLLASWRYVPHPMSPIQALLAAAPASTEHWKQQLMHVVAFFPFLQPGEKIPIELWQLIVKRLEHEVLPVRQVSLLVFNQLLRLQKHHSEQDNEVDQLVMADSTLRVLIVAYENNHRNTHRFAASADGQHANSAPSNWSFGVNEVIRYLSNSSGTYPKPPPLSSIRLLNLTSDAFKTVGVAQMKLVQRLVQLNPEIMFSNVVIDALLNLATKTDSKCLDEDRQAALLTLAEWVGGMLRGLLKLEVTQPNLVENALNSIIGLLEKTLPQVSVALIEPWCHLLYFVTRPSNANRRLHFERLESTVQYVLNELKQSFVCATTEDYAHQVKWLSLIEPVLIHFLPHLDLADDPRQKTAIHLQSALIDVLRSHGMAHRYKMIRDRVARTLFILDAHSGTDDSTMSSIRKELLSSTCLHPNVSSDIQEGEADESPTALNAKETAIQWLAITERFGEAWDFARVQSTLFPIAFITQNHSKAEVAVLAKNATNAVSLSLRLYSPPEDVEASRRQGDLISMLEEFAAHKFWKTRGAGFALFDFIYFLPLDLFVPRVQGSRPSAHHNVLE